MSVQHDWWVQHSVASMTGLPSSAPVNNHMLTMHKAATQAARLTTSHPWCKASDVEWETCMQMVDTAESVTEAHAALGSTTSAMEIINQLVSNNTFGNQDTVRRSFLFAMHVSAHAHISNVEAPASGALAHHLPFRDSTHCTHASSTTTCVNIAAGGCAHARWHGADSGLRQPHHQHLGDGGNDTVRGRQPVILSAQRICGLLCVHPRAARPLRLPPHSSREHERRE